MRPISDQNKEVSSRAIRLVAPGHGNDPTHVLHVIGLIRHHSLHARREFGAPAFAGGEISSLDDKTLDDAAESCRVERARSGKVQKIPHSLWRLLWHHFNDDCALFT